MNRREVLGVLAGGTLLVACGDDGGFADAKLGNCSANGTAISISANHGHVLVVSKEDVAAGVDMTYDIMGTAAHTHSVTITAAQFATLQTNQSITTTSTVASSHSHTIVVMCA